MTDLSPRKITYSLIRQLYPYSRYFCPGSRALSKCLDTLHFIGTHFHQLDTFECPSWLVSQHFKFDSISLDSRTKPGTHNLETKSLWTWFFTGRQHVLAPNGWWRYITVLAGLVSWLAWLTHSNGKLKCQLVWLWPIAISWHSLSSSAAKIS